MMTEVLCTNEHSIYRGHRARVLSWHVLREKGDTYDYTVAYAIVAWKHNNRIELMGVGDLEVVP